ncbi:hypothetical protein STEG23_000851 [Scotinomys teguina]
MGDRVTKGDSPKVAQPNERRCRYHGYTVETRAPEAPAYDPEKGIPAATSTLFPEQAPKSLPWSDAALIYTSY